MTHRRRRRLRCRLLPSFRLRELNVRALVLEMAGLPAMVADVRPLRQPGGGLATQLADHRGGGLELPPEPPSTKRGCDLARGGKQCGVLVDDQGALPTVHLLVVAAVLHRRAWRGGFAASAARGGAAGGASALDVQAVPGLDVVVLRDDAREISRPRRPPTAAALVSERR
jgi:hypothetical protein